MKKFLSICFSFSIVISFLPVGTLAQSGLQNKQDTVWFMNGEVLVAKVADTTGEQVRCVYMKRKKDKAMKIDKDRIFSIKFSNHKEKIYYTYDTLVGNFFTVEETRYFVIGEQDAIKGFKPRMAAVGGFVIGAASPIVFSASIISPIPPFLFAGIVKLPKVRVNTGKISNREYLKIDTYLLGYERVARKKKTFYALIGGAAGLATGFAVYVGILKEKVQ